MIHIESRLKRARSLFPLSPTLSLPLSSHPSPPLSPLSTPRRFLKTKWDSLATPKHSSPQLTKRAQIQQEFSRPITRNSSTSPAAQARLLGTFTVNVGESTPVPTSAAAATTTAAAAIPPVSTSSAVGNGGATTVHRKKSAQHARRQGDTKGKE